MAWVSSCLWSLDIVENLEGFTNLHVILSQGPCYSSLYGSNFVICVAMENTIMQFFNWIDESLSLGRQPLLVVTLNHRSFATSPNYQGIARDDCSRFCLAATWASKGRSTRSPMVVWRGCFRADGHLRLLKIWNASRILVSFLWMDHSNLLCIVPILIYVLLQLNRSHNSTPGYINLCH